MCFSIKLHLTTYRNMPKHKSKKDSSDSDSGPEDVSFIVISMFYFIVLIILYREVQSRKQNQKNLQNQVMMILDTVWVKTDLLNYLNLKENGTLTFESIITPMET